MSTARSAGNGYARNSSVPPMALMARLKTTRESVKRSTVMLLSLVARSVPRAVQVERAVAESGYDFVEMRLPSLDEVALLHR